jgi:hypothetical protein
MIPQFRFPVNREESQESCRAQQGATGALASCQVPTHGMLVKDRVTRRLQPRSDDREIRAGGWMYAAFHAAHGYLVRT